MDSYWQMKIEVFVDKPVPETICPHQTPHQLIQSNPGPRGERPASTNRMSPEGGHNIGQFYDFTRCFVRTCNFMSCIRGRTQI